MKQQINKVRTIVPLENSPILLSHRAMDYWAAIASADCSGLIHVYIAIVR